jgi:hypothetical protein
MFRGRTKCLCEAQQFKIANPPKLPFNFSQRFTANVPAPTSAASSQHRLREPLPVSKQADLRPDQISWTFAAFPLGFLLHSVLATEA